MKFVIPGGNVKTTGKVIHCLAKIGDEVYLEPSLDGLTLRSVNLSRSAFAQFSFGSSFFSSIEQAAEASDEDSGNENCRVMVRSLLLAFRSLSSLEKTVETCCIQIDNINCKIDVSFKCRHSVSKEFSLGLLEYENTRPTYDINECNNKWVIQSGVMQEANGNFLANQEEVTMTVRADSFKLNNYNDVIDEKKQVQSEVSMQPGEFETYEISKDSSVTFCLKEFRSLLAFAEFSQLPIIADFSDGGAPLILSLSQGEMLTCTYVLATLADDDNFQPSSNSSEPMATNEKILSAPPVGLGLLHSTQNENGHIEAEMPDLSTIPHPEPDVKSFEEPNEIDGSPPAKKKTFLFRRCFNSTWHPSKVPGHQQVLAPDSDDEM